MNRLFFAVSFSISVLLSTGIQAQSEPQTITLDQAIINGLKNNKSLKIEQINPQLYEQSIQQGLSAFDPTISSSISYSSSKDPTSSTLLQDSINTRATTGSASLTKYFSTGTTLSLGASQTHREGNTRNSDYDGSVSITLTQNLLKNNRKEVNLVDVNQAVNNQAISKYALKDYTRTLIHDIIHDYWNLKLAEKVIEIRRFSVKLANSQQKLVEAYIKEGKSAQGELYSAKSEVQARKSELTSAIADYEKQSISFSRTIGFPISINYNPLTASDPIQVVEDQQPDLSFSTIYTNRPEVRQYELDLENQNLEIVQTKNGLLPDLDFFISAGRLSSGDRYVGTTSSLDENRYQNYELGFSFDMTLGNRSEKASMKSAALNKDQAEKALENLLEVITEEVQHARIDLKSTLSQIEANRSEEKNRTEEVRIISAKYEVSKSTILDVLEVQDSLINAQLKHVQSKIEYLKAVTTLALTEGTLLSKYNVEIETNGEYVR